MCSDRALRSRLVGVQLCQDSERLDLNARCLDKELLRRACILDGKAHIFRHIHCVVDSWLMHDYPRA